MSLQEILGGLTGEGLRQKRASWDGGDKGCSKRNAGEYYCNVLFLIRKRVKEIDPGTLNQ